MTPDGSSVEVRQLTLVGIAEAAAYEDASREAYPRMSGVVSGLCPKVGHLTADRAPNHPCFTDRF